jgi:hypothetical protein
MKPSARCAETWRAAGEETSIGIIGKSDLPRDGQLVTTGHGIDRLVVGNRLQLEIFAGAAQGSLLTHHGGDAIGFLALRPLLLSRLLAILEAAQPVVQFLSGTFLQWVTP